MIGHVTGSAVTGNYILRDRTHSIHIISPTMALHWNTIMIIKEYDIITESVLRSHSSLCQHAYSMSYIKPISWDYCTLMEANTLKYSLYFTIERKSHFTNVSFHNNEIKVIVHTELEQLNSPSVQSYTIQISNSLMAYLQYGYTYRLSTNVPVGPLYTVSEWDIIELVSPTDNMCHHITPISELLASNDRLVYIQYYISCCIACIGAVNWCVLVVRLYLILFVSMTHLMHVPTVVSV